VLSALATSHKIGIAIAGAAFIPGDGYIDPYSMTMALQHSWRLSSRTVLHQTMMCKELCDDFSGR
jgi:hypothetical protein